MQISFLDKAVRMAYYAVRVGKKPGVYSSWSECKEQVLRVPKARYAKFPTEEMAREFLRDDKKKSDVICASTKSGFTDGLTKYTSKLMKDKTEDSVDCNVSNITPLVANDDSNDCKKTTEDINLNILHNIYEIWHPVEGTFIIYTDGACPFNGQEGAIAGYGVHFPTLPQLDTCGRVEGKQTNQRAELIAIQKALELVSSLPLPLEIRTDSMYSINCLTRWCHIWRDKGWEVNILNLDLIRAIIDICNDRSHPVYFVHAAFYNTDCLETRKGSFW